MSTHRAAVWVFVEHKLGAPVESAIEAVTEGRRLADLARQGLTVLTFGSRSFAVAESVAPYGADTVLWAEREEWAYDQPEEYAAVISALVKEHSPSIVLSSSTPLGEEVACRVAARVRAPFVSRCDKLELTPGGELLGTRLCYEGKVHATLSCGNDGPRLATLSPGAVKARKVGNPKVPDVARIDLARYEDSCRARTRVVGFVKADPSTIDISESEIIVAGGKGVGADFSTVFELAGLLGGSVAGSRMAVDAGGIGKERQIGQSGKSVSPELLVSCGISGANAHTIGMRDAKVVIAINKDKNATMMKLADLGVVGDFHEIGPVLVDRLREVTSAKGSGA